MGSRVPIKPKDQQHVPRKQIRVRYGVGGFFLVTMAFVVFGPWVGAIHEEFARQIMQTVLPPLLASGATIIGTPFTSDHKE